MNYDFALYNKTDGMFAHTVNMPEEDAEIQDPAFWVVQIDLETFNECSMFDGTNIVNLPPKPAVYMVWNQAAEAWEDPRTEESKNDYLEALKAEQLWKVNKAFEVACKALTETYPETEKITWNIQQNEAFAWHANPQAETPFLSVVAETRGIDLIDLLEKTYQKILQFQQYSAQLIGKRQKYEDAIYACTTEQEVQQIMWE